MSEVRRSSPLTADDLWPVMSDVRRWPDWLPTVDSVTPVQPDRADEVGASYVLRQPGLPRATWTITDWRPGAGFTWQSQAPGVRSVGRHELVAEPEGTSVVLGLEWHGALAGVVRLLLGRRARDYVTREAETLLRTAAERAGR